MTCFSSQGSAMKNFRLAGRSGKSLEAPPGFEPGSQGFADPCLTTWLWRQKISAELYWSGKRDSNSRHSPWQGDALPLSHSRI